MVAARHDHVEPGLLNGSCDVAVIRGDMHVSCAAFPGALGYAHHHRTAADIGEHLSGQTARREACGDNNGK
jgi:hypothetical protein